MTFPRATNAKSRGGPEGSALPPQLRTQAVLSRLGSLCSSSFQDFLRKGFKEQVSSPLFGHAIAVVGISTAEISWMDVALKPFFRRKFLLSRAERYFYGVLRRIVVPHTVHAKVRLADLVEADERHRLRQANFRRICSKHVDFVVCDAALCPIIAVELDDSSHQRPDRQARDRDVDRILEIASLPILRVPVRRTYDDDDIERQLRAKLKR